MVSNTEFINNIKRFLDNKKILILGFGREGKSTYEFIKKYVNYSSLTIADKNRPECDECVIFGENYLDTIDEYDVVIKSPGIPFLGIKNKKCIITSQTELLLKYNSKNIIGVTGTKGKSTTTSLIYHILKYANVDCCLIGNIGIPAFSCFNSISEDTKLVYELSSHQLEHVKASPHISILLNIFEEHLDHYKSYEEYQLAKVNIFRYQSGDDVIIYNKENKLVREYVDKFAKGKKLSFPYEYKAESKLFGEHNQKNIMAARLVASSLNVNEEIIKQAVKDFNGLEHRLEFVGDVGEIKYYNDSISTIPEATIMAIESLKDVDTVIIGGMDRGIHYDNFIKYLENCNVSNIILTYDTGKKIFETINREGVVLVDDLEEAVRVAKNVTEEGKICLLSPAAASYGFFKNFEERGNRFKELVHLK